MTQNNHYDVVICGGGFAGQTLARQLRLNYPDMTILMLERRQFPVAEATHKVGESTIEIAADYLAEDLQLREYMETRHIRKLGLRYFWSNPEGTGELPFAERPELGLSRYPMLDSYQMDVGRLENDLWEMNKAAGIHSAEQVTVKDMVIHDGQANEVQFQQEGEDRIQTVTARWVIDAMGRRRFLQRKLDLKLEAERMHSSVWFRVKGQVDLDALVPDANTAWHQRMVEGKRWQSTVHLMGPGYWVWLIPLSSGHTSIGIVTAEKWHSFLDYNTPERAMAWLDKHEFTVSRYLQEFEVADFLKMRNYSFSSKQVASAQGWACIGDSAVFADPFYSPGSYMISQENAYLTQMIGMDMVGKLCEKTVAMYNDTIIGTSDTLGKQLQESYAYFDHPVVFSCNHIWGVLINWGIAVPIKRTSLYLDQDWNARIDMKLADAYALMALVDELFLVWREKSRNRLAFDFIDYRGLPFIKEMAALQGRENPGFEQVEADCLWMAGKLEELAQVMFRLMLEDSMPEQLERLPEPLWINAWAMSLEPDRWEQDGLFAPKTEPRDLSDMLAQFRSLYTLRKS